MREQVFSLTGMHFRSRLVNLHNRRLRRELEILRFRYEMQIKTNDGLMEDLTAARHKLHMEGINFD